MKHFGRTEDFTEKLVDQECRRNAIASMSKRYKKLEVCGGILFVMSILTAIEHLEIATVCFVLLVVVVWTTLGRLKSDIHLLKIMDMIGDLAKNKSTQLGN